MNLSRFFLDSLSFLKGVMFLEGPSFEKQNCGEIRFFASILLFTRLTRSQAMNSIPANFTFTFSKTPPIYKRAPAIDNLPEEVASSIAKWIAEWADISGNENERDRGRR